jgi:hypothetical protein
MHFFLFGKNILEHIQKTPFCIALLLCIVSVEKTYAAYELPDQFYVTQHWLSLTSGFDVETDTEKLGTVYRRFFSWTTQYDFYNNDGSLEATAKSRFWSLGAMFDVFDLNDHLIGHVVQRLLTFFPTYEIRSNTDEVLAKAKMNLWGTTYYVTDPATSLEIAQIYRSFFRLKDDWTVKIVNRDLLLLKNIDPQLFVTLAVFQSDVDTRKRYEHWQREQERGRQEHQRGEEELADLLVEELADALDKS